MNPISNTAFYCCGIRMEDAKRTHSVCNDHYAERFMDARGRAIFEPFKAEKRANCSNIARCRIIDDHIKTELKEDPGLTVITVGAGFDTRPYRHKGGTWIEIDEAQIIDYKNTCLPVAECPNPLTRISIDFSRDSLADTLEPFSHDRHTIFVIEGVLMYLEPFAITSTLQAIQQTFQQHVIYCDLMTRQFFEQFAQSVHDKLVAAGGSFTNRPDAPEEIFLQLGYHPLMNTTMFQRAAELGLFWDELRLPRPVAWLMLNWLKRDLGGYAVHKFAFKNECP